jgi:hypothetical protein
LDAISPSTSADRKRSALIRIKLTEQRVASLPSPSRGTTYIYDTVVPCLAVRVTATGVRTFVVVKKVSGKSHRENLGRFPGLRLYDARQAANRFIGDLARGADPVALRKAARARKFILADLWPSYLAHLRQRNRTWARDQERWDSHVNPALGRKALAEITRGDCQALVDKIGLSAPIAANRIAAFLSAILNFAIRTDRLAVNPAKNLIRFPETARARVLRSDELPKLLASIETAGEPWRAVLKMLLYTGARKGSVISMRWEDRSGRRSLDHPRRVREKQDHHPSSAYGACADPAPGAIGEQSGGAVGLSQSGWRWPRDRVGKSMVAYPPGSWHQWLAHSRYSTVGGDCACQSRCQPTRDRNRIGASKHRFCQSLCSAGWRGCQTSLGRRRCGIDEYQEGT